MDVCGRVGRLLIPRPCTILMKSLQFHSLSQKPRPTSGHNREKQGNSPPGHVPERLAASLIRLAADAGGTNASAPDTNPVRTPRRGVTTTCYSRGYSDERISRRRILKPHHPRSAPPQPWHPLPPSHKPSASPSAPPPPPPASRPCPSTLHQPTLAALGFPTGLPGITLSASWALAMLRSGFLSCRLRTGGIGRGWGR